jgi:hypothetical protein
MPCRPSQYSEENQRQRNPRITIFRLSTILYIRIRILIYVSIKTKNNKSPRAVCLLHFRSSYYPRSSPTLREKKMGGEKV